MNVGENIKKIRKEKGLTQKELGIRLGVSQAAIGQFENTEANLKMETIKKIAEALEVDYTRLIIETPFSSGSKEEREKMSLEELAEYLAYSTTNDPLQKKEILNQREERIKKASSNTIVIDTSKVENHPFTILQKKVENGEELTEEEKTQFNAYMKDAISSLSNALKKFGETLKECYQLLNDEGQKKANEQIEHAVKQVEMLTKIPEYQRKEESED